MPRARELPGLLAPTLGVVLATALACWLAYAWRGIDAFAESGPIETASALGYAGAAIVCLAAAFRGDARLRLPGAALLGVLCARELDLHAALPVGSLTRTATYVNPDTPLAARLAAGLIVLAILAAALAFLATVLGRWRRGALPPTRALVATLAAIALLGVAKGLDGIGRKAAGFGIATGADLDLVAMMIEETLELCAPMLLVLATATLLTGSERDASRG